MIPIIDSGSHDRDYYCSIKFRFLKIDPCAKTVYNCHAASPHKIDFNWLEKNPGQLFNDSINVLEREQMLRNERNASCEQNCWPAEDRGAISPRIYQNGSLRVDNPAITQPDLVDFVINNDCNLTCSYCCKEYSSAWRRDLLLAGNYHLTDYNDKRYDMSPKDLALDRISQPDLKKSNSYQMLVDELVNFLPGLTELTLAGGEPFLDNGFFASLSERATNTNINLRIYSGLGVEAARLENIVKKLRHFPNVQVTVSGENVREFLEFNRYGIKWKQFLDNIAILKDYGIKINHQATLTALTLPGFKDFVDMFSGSDIVMTFAYQPRFMACHVLDDQSKILIQNQISNFSSDWQTKILNSIAATPLEQERKNLKEFIVRFTRARPDISCTIFPKHFTDWLGI